MEELAAIAETHLPPDLAERWLGLVRPTIGLYPVRAGEEVVARLGGHPRLPEGVGWPAWEGVGPMSYIAEVDLDAVARAGLTVNRPLPPAGRLLFFWQEDGRFRTKKHISYADAVVHRGRVIHAPAVAEIVETPEGVPTYEKRELAGRQTYTFPDSTHPVMEVNFYGVGMHHEDWSRHPVNRYGLQEALQPLMRFSPMHQIGGYAIPIQDHVEWEAGGDRYQAAGARRASEWAVLLQIASDADMMWGDVGDLYWITHGDTSESLGRVATVMQCS